MSSYKHFGKSKTQYNVYPFIRVSVYKDLISINVYFCSAMLEH